MGNYTKDTNCMKEYQYLESLLLSMFANAHRLMEELKIWKLFESF